MAGISAGFASVFGPPLTGALFGLEVLAIGRMRYDALLPCVVTAIIADQVGQAWGVVHMHRGGIGPQLTKGAPKKQQHSANSIQSQRSMAQECG